jgi:uncharacterized membrane protein
MTDTTTFESNDTDEQRAGFEQSKSQRITTATEFFREKFADEERSEYEWIDPKGGNAADESEVSP